MTRTGVEFSDIWDTIKDVVTDESFLVVLGSVITAGQAGWLLGVLGSAQQVALQQTMNALAGVVLRCNYDPTCVLRGNANFFDAWKAQLAWRTAKTMQVGGAQLAAGVIASSQLLAQAVNFGNSAVTAYEEARRLYPSSSSAAKAQTLRRLKAECNARHPGRITPEQRRLITECRDDVLALAANFHLRDNVFVTTDWDPLTGDAPPDAFEIFRTNPRKLYTLAELDALWKGARDQGLPASIVTPLADRYAFEYHLRRTIIGLPPAADPALPITLANVEVTSPATDAARARWVDARQRGYAKAIVDQLQTEYETLLARDRAAAAPTPTTAPLPGDVAPKPSWLGEIALAAVLTSPAWIGLAVLPWWQKRREGYRLQATGKREGRRRA